MKGDRREGHGEWCRQSSRRGLVCAAHRRSRPAAYQENLCRSPPARTVLPPVQGGQCGVAGAREHGEVHQIRVEVQDVKAGREPFYLLHHHQVIGNVLPHIGVKPQSLPATGEEAGGGLGIAAGKQRYVMSLPDQFVCQVGDDAFCSAIEPRRHALNERGNLGDLHGCTLAKLRADVITAKPEVGSVCTVREANSLAQLTDVSLPGRLAGAIDQVSLHALPRLVENLRRFGFGGIARALA